MAGDWDDHAAGMISGPGDTGAPDLARALDVLGPRVRGDPHALRVHIEPSLSILTSLLVDSVCCTNPTYHRLLARPPGSLRQRLQTIQPPPFLHADPGGNRGPNVPGTNRIATLLPAGHRTTRLRTVRMPD